MDKQTILIVDDVEINRDILSAILEEDYDILTACNGAEAFDIVRANGRGIAAILLDIVMPVMDGYAFLRLLSHEENLPQIPVLVISAEDTVAEKKVFAMGVVDFIHKPFDGDIVKHRVKNTVELYTYQNHLEAMVAEQTEELLQANEQLKYQHAQLETVNERIIEMLGAVVESRNLESGEHIQRVKGYTAILAKKAMVLYPELGLTEEKIRLISTASALHDVGKIAIPDNILLKPGRLTPEEFEIMKTHSEEGYKLLKQFDYIWNDEYGAYCRNISRWHHERYDGRGYPDHLVGDQIPVEAQLVSLADVYDALVNKRCYKEPFGFETTFDMICTGKCGTFSDWLVACFVASRAEMEAFAKGDPDLQML
ncbi:MAG: response regulator [Clostridia bacterium]|nr:response regulator [Clostridia bacterium]